MKTAPYAVKLTYTHALTLKGFRRQRQTEREGSRLFSAAGFGAPYGLPTLGALEPLWMEWRNQVAVVTGGARGLGRATARLLARRGAAVCVNYAVHAEEAEAAVDEIAAAGGRAIALGADVADSAALEDMVGRAEAELGPVTILVNNAGVAWRGTPLLPHSP